jgi:hypothetical protein
VPRLRLDIKGDLYSYAIASNIRSPRVGDISIVLMEINRLPPLRAINNNEKKSERSDVRRSLSDIILCLTGASFVFKGLMAQ